VLLRKTVEERKTAKKRKKEGVIKNVKGEERGMGEQEKMNKRFHYLNRKMWQGYGTWERKRGIERQGRGKKTYPHQGIC
jgi:hypothetical protein